MLIYFYSSPKELDYVDQSAKPSFNPPTKRYGYSISNMNGAEEEEDARKKPIECTSIMYNRTSYGYKKYFNMSIRLLETLPYQ